VSLIHKVLAVFSTLLAILFKVGYSDFYYIRAHVLRPRANGVHA